MNDESKEEVSLERKFLHDFATPMSVIRLHTKRLLKISKEKSWSEVETKLLEQILDSVSRLDIIHGDFKESLSKRTKR